jgi:hypothetical protein
MRTLGARFSGSAPRDATSPANEAIAQTPTKLSASKLDQGGRK